MFFFLHTHVFLFSIKNFALNCIIRLISFFIPMFFLIPGESFIGGIGQTVEKRGASRTTNNPITTNYTTNHPPHLIHPFHLTHSPIPPHSFIHPPIPPHSFIHPPIQPHSFIHPPIPPHSFIHPPIQPHPSIHSPILRSIHLTISFYHSSTLLPTIPHAGE